VLDLPIAGPRRLPLPVWLPKRLLLPRRCSQWGGRTGRAQEVMTLVKVMAPQTNRVGGARKEDDGICCPASGGEECLPVDSSPNWGAACPWTGLPKARASGPRVSYRGGWLPQAWPKSPWGLAFPNDYCSI
jgi:hypothetical protein